MRRLRYAASAAVLALGLAACGGSDEPVTPEPSTSPTSTGPTTADPEPSESPSTAASGGTADQPEVVEPATDLLDWRPVDGPVGDTVTRSGDWTLRVTGNGRGYQLDGPGSSSGSGSSGGSRSQVSEALIDGDWAVVVLQDRHEQRPSVAEVTELATGKTFRIDGGSDLPTHTGGTWALGEGRLLHATVHDGDYCVATVDLASRTSTLGWCAPDRQGFNDARITPAGTALQTFDDSQPACRTLVTLEGDRVTPFPGVADCKGWDGLLTDDGAVWSVIPKERQIEAAHFYARAGEGYFDLGPGTAGSLTWCAGAAYFVRDPQREGDPAALVRWSADTGLAVVYQSPGGQAFLDQPRCGGDALTVTALAEDGDEQVTATLD
ncbi:hypothetical protein [Nocardioides sp. T2.26MG-1]|uniref:hypothetical protein n=1 Tax=Nocardioides sp. T2.26MG-1 TaxID=3041166 RepID=UPI002477A3A0|nr:hypothetical protein [Nocardioides sp. T2.26MG-1]CAI9411987.1 hypothetical protein HIDPHFAB_01655 [Nocardioides sp. T2.26MG-1]